MRRAISHISTKRAIRRLNHLEDSLDLAESQLADFELGFASRRGLKESLATIRKELEKVTRDVPPVKELKALISKRLDDLVEDFELRCRDGLSPDLASPEGSDPLEFSSSMRLELLF